MHSFFFGRNEAWRIYPVCDMSQTTQGWDEYVILQYLCDSDRLEFSKDYFTNDPASGGLAGARDPPRGGGPAGYLRCGKQSLTPGSDGPLRVHPQRCEKLPTLSAEIHMGAQRCVFFYPPGGGQKDVFSYPGGY